MLRLRLLLSIGSLLAASVAANGADELTRREKGDLSLHARAILLKYCGDCHGKEPAPPTLSLLDHNQMIAPGPPVPFVNRNDPPRSQVIEFIEDGSMPPGGRRRPTADELDTLKKWVKHKAPSYPQAFDDASTLAAMLDDLDRQKPEDVPHLRYLSFTHLIRDGAELPNLGTAERRLNLAILAGSGKSVVLEPVDDTATLFRLDLRPLAWGTPDLFEQILKQKSAGVYPIVPFDLVLNEYPNAFAVPGKEAQAQAGRLNAFFAATKQLRKVPFLRADWLGDALARGTPLAADLNSLVALAEAQAKKTPPPCGPVPRPFVDAKAEFEEPGPVPPLTSWYGGGTGPTPEMAAVTVEVVRPLQGNKPTGEVEVGGQYRLRLKAERASRDYRFLVLSVLATGDIRVQPVGEGNVLKRGETRLLGPEQGKPFVSGSILTGTDAETEHYVVIAAEGAVPVPTIIRSIHPDGLDCRKKNQQPVWRFLYDRPTDDFDPAKALRTVVPLTITKKKV